MKIKQAIIPVAGFGTRRLPVTKSIEKCMLPICNRPIIDYVVEDCIAAGVERIIFVVNKDSDQLRSYYGRNLPLEEYLSSRKKETELQEITKLASKATFEYIIQPQNADQPYGTAAPVAMCSKEVGADEQVIIAMGDDFIYNRDGSSDLARLATRLEQSPATSGMLATNVPRETVARYGVLDTHSEDSNLFFNRVFEHADPATAPSTLINISKYIFDKKMFDFVDDVMTSAPAANGEYQLTEALNKYVSSGSPLLVLPAEGMFLDGGNLEGWITANNVVSKDLLAQ